MPSPFGCIDIRVADQISWFNIIQLRVIGRKLCRKRHVVAKTDKVDTSTGKNRVIFWCDIEVESFPGKVIQHMLRIISTSMNISKPVTTMHRFRGHHHIVGCTRQRIDGAHGDHTANVKFRIDRFSSLYRQGTGN
ncbi:Uncharacterised protein [Shigella sonnei]|nr:Uncharacterised protein [Shigella sonnei]